jgi:hypothetical protein
MKKTIGILGMCGGFFLLPTFSSLAQTTNNLPFEEMGISLEEFQAMNTHKDVKSVVSYTGTLRAVGVKEEKTKTTKITPSPLKDNPCLWHGVPFNTAPMVPISEDAIREEGYDGND